MTFEIGCDCGFATYSLNADNTVKVKNCCERLPNTHLSCVEGKAAVSFPDEVPLQGKLNVTFGASRYPLPPSTGKQLIQL